MHLIYVTTSLPFGPGEAFVATEIKELQRQGNQIQVVPMRPRGAVIHEIAESLLPCTSAQPLLSWMIAREAASVALRHPLRTLRAIRLVAISRPGPLIKNLAVFPKALWLAAEARRVQAEHIHCHWAGATATMAMVASSLSGVPWSFTAHRWDIVENNLLARKAKSAQFMRFISQSGKKLAEQAGVSPSANELILPMGVEMESAALSRPSTTRPFRLLCPASLTPVKGHRYLIEALRLVGGPIELWIAGEGPEQVRLVALTRALHLGDSVRYLGHLEHRKLLELYRSGEVDAVVLASVDLGDGLHEGIPVALMEGMAAGLPVIGTATGGTPELLGDDAGLLVPPQDPGALAEAINALATNPALRVKLGRAGRARVEQEYSIAQIVRALVNAIERNPESLQ